MYVKTKIRMLTTLTRPGSTTTRSTLTATRSESRYFLPSGHQTFAQSVKDETCKSWHVLQQSSALGYYIFYRPAIIFLHSLLKIKHVNHDIQQTFALGYYIFYCRTIIFLQSIQDKKCQSWLRAVLCSRILYFFTVRPSDFCSLFKIRHANHEMQ